MPGVFEIPTEFSRLKSHPRGCNVEIDTIHIMKNRRFKMQEKSLLPQNLDSSLLGDHESFFLDH